MQIPKASPSAARLFEELTPVEQSVTARRMFGQPCAFVNRNMFFGVFGQNLFLRLSEADRAVAKSIPGFNAFEPVSGRAMKEYLVLPRSILGNRTEARRWVARSFGYASSLPAKKGKNGRK